MGLADLLLPYRTITIIGMDKNVGKTTTLNRLILDFNKRDIRLSLTGIGRDGEDCDIVTNTAKPRIFVQHGTTIITTEALLGFCDITKEITAVTDYHTPMGRVVVVVAKSDGFVQIGGPSTLSQLEKLIGNTFPHLKSLTCTATKSKNLNILCTGRNFTCPCHWRLLQTGNFEFKTEEVARSQYSECAQTISDEEKYRLYHSDKLIIDGAISRKSLARLGNAVILCAGAGQNSDMQKVIAETRHAVNILTLTKPCDSAKRIYLEGAVSDKRLAELITSGDQLKDTCIIADDPGKIFIKPETYEKLLIKKGILSVKNPVNLAAVTINPISVRGYAFDPAEFLVKMQNALPVPVFDVEQML